MSGHFVGTVPEPPENGGLFAKRPIASKRGIEVWQPIVETDKIVFDDI